MGEGKIYMTDATAEAMGGREHVEGIYERVGDGGHIVIHSPTDSREQVEFLFRIAAMHSNADPILTDEESIDNFVDKAMSFDDPLFYSMDLDGDGTFDLASYRYLPERFEADTWWRTFPGDSPELVRDFITAHEFGHKKMRGIDSGDFWSVWQSETDADQDAFRGMGERATVDFQMEILAARAGNALHLFGEGLATGSEYFQSNMSFKHASVLNTFLPFELPYSVTEETLTASVTEFRELIVAKMHDNHATQNPDFEIDISGLSELFIGVDNMRDLADIEQDVMNFKRFIEQKDPITAGVYSQFQSNLDTLFDQVTTLNKMKDFFDGNDAAFVEFGNTEQRSLSYRPSDSDVIPIIEQITAEYHEALSFMRDTHPEMFRAYIAQNHSDLITEQTGVVNEDLYSDTGYLNLEVFHENNAQLAQIVLQLRDEGAFDDDPIQKRLADYIEIDMDVRPVLYEQNRDPSISANDIPSEPSAGSEGLNYSMKV